MKKKKEKNSKKLIEKKVRAKISQADIPGYSLLKSIEVARALYENFGKDPAKPLRVAEAMSLSPNSSYFRQLTGASIAYGLTDGGSNAPTISLTSLGRRILAPTQDGDDIKAKQEAILKPKVISNFLQKYNDSPFPSEIIAKNVLEQEMGVPKERVSQVLNLIIESAKEVGFFREIKGKNYIDLSGVNINSSSGDDEDDSNLENSNLEEQEDENNQKESNQHNTVKDSVAGNANTKRVFITHGKNQSFLEPIKKLLSFGGFEPVVASEKQTVSQPVPEKVMESMRICGAAIIHIDAEQKLIDGDAKEHITLNPNVLIEIGAAMALYGKRFILLVKNGVALPSNLQGLYEVRYSGENLDSEVTIKLLEAINDIKNHPLP